MLPLELQNREGDGGFDVRQGLGCPLAGRPLMGLVEERIQANPARCDVRGGQREDVLAVRGLSAVVADFSPSVSICQKPGVFRSSPE